MQPKHTLGKIHLVVADADQQMGRVTADMLDAIGFGKVTHVAHGKRALDVIRHDGADIVVTDWHMPVMDGIALMRYLRRSEDSPGRTLPIIMLTARAERPDVEAARDAGVTEFVVKPYTTRTLFTRIGQLIEHPRPLVFSANYAGPERRRKAQDSAGNRRVRMPLLVQSEAAVGTDYHTPRMLPPDFALKRKIGLEGDIGLLITDAVLEAAQRALDTMQGEALGWVREDMMRLEEAHARASIAGADAQAAMEEALLAIKARGGTFGYEAASTIAQMGYHFLRSVFVAGNAQHYMVMLKHIQALKVIFVNEISGDGGAMASQLIGGLHMLTQKYGVE